MKNIKISKIYFLIYLLLETRFFYLIYFEKIDNFISIKNKLLITYFCLLLLLIGIIVTNKIKINNLNRWLTVYILFILFESFKNIFYYKLNLSQVITSIHGFLILLLAPFLIDIFKSKKDLKFIIKSITITSIIISALFIVQAIIYNINGQIILKVLKENDLIYEIRSYGIRLSQPSTIIVLSILISWGCLQQNYKNKLHLINIIISLTYIFMVSQTRMINICLIMTFIITFLLKKIEKFSIKKILIILLCFSLTFIFPFILEKYFDRSSGSVYARVYSIHYYLSEFAKRPVFGIGLLPDDKTNATIRIALHGEKEYANTTDIGIIGYLFQFGIVGILLLIWLTKYVIKEIRNCIYKDELYYIVVSCWIYIILSSSTLIVFDTQRIVMLPIILYFTFILNNKVNSNE